MSTAQRPLVGREGVPCGECGSTDTSVTERTIFIGHEGLRSVLEVTCPHCETIEEY